MPRLTHRLLRQAQATNHLLPLLLRACRDLGDAQNELRWLREFAQQQAPSRFPQPKSAEQHLRQLCIQRSTGRPLQYILGNQPFGELDILCRPGVLIPRPETESYTTFLAHCLRLSRSSPSPHGLRIMDLCTGTGCIALLLHSLLATHYDKLRIEGVDISTTALNLAKRNLAHNVKGGNLKETALSQIRFQHGDVLSHDHVAHDHDLDVVISNPPYISQTSFNKDTTRSTRIFEPRLALVPQVDPLSSPHGVDLTGDVFYHKIVAFAQAAGAKVAVMEVADDEQAQRVVDWVDAAFPGKYWQASIWHDNLYNWEPFDLFASHAKTFANSRIGTGNARAVVLAAG